MLHVLVSMYCTYTNTERQKTNKLKRRLIKSQEWFYIMYAFKIYTTKIKNETILIPSPNIVNVLFGIG